jgi:hypothetical protein
MSDPRWAAQADRLLERTPALDYAFVEGNVDDALVVFLAELLEAAYTEGLQEMRWRVLRAITAHRPWPDLLWAPDVIHAILDLPPGPGRA